MSYHRPDAFKRVHADPTRFPLPAMPAAFARSLGEGALSRQDLRRIVADMVD